MAHQVLALEAMTDYERGITVSVGTIAGGTVTNCAGAPLRTSACPTWARPRTRCAACASCAPWVRMELDIGELNRRHGQTEAAACWRWSWLPSAPASCRKTRP